MRNRLIMYICETYTHYVCDNLRCTGRRKLAKAYSLKHYTELGWIFFNDGKYDEKPSSYCPSCAKKMREEGIIK